jgi:predicted dinucleotide-binding enzyme
MQVAIIGAGRIGGNCARRAVKAGHDVVITYTRNPDGLSARADELGASSEPDVAAAVADADVVVLSVPWDSIDDALAQARGLGDLVVIDTTNQYGKVSPPPDGQTAAQHNAARMPQARYTKSFNTLTAAFQGEAAERPREQRVVQWIAGDDAGAKAVVATLIEQMGYEPVDLGGTATCAVMEAPRRPAAVYGEEYRLADGLLVAEAVAAGREIPPAPVYA